MTWAESRPLTYSEATQLYAECGSTRQFGMRVGLSQPAARNLLHRLGVTMRGRGYTHTPRGSRAVVVKQCTVFNRPCVIHDLPGSCATCRAEHTLDSVCAGASSGWVTAVIGGGR